MASTPRYRSGKQLLRPFTVDSATVVELSDLMYWDTDDAKPVSSYDNSSTSELADQAALANVFIGPSNSKSASGDTDAIDIDVSAESIYEYDLTSATPTVGTKLTIESSGGAMLDQKLQTTTTASLAVGLCADRYTAATTKVKCTFASAYHTGSSNANVQLG